MHCFFRLQLYLVHTRFRCLRSIVVVACQSFVHGSIYKYIFIPFAHALSHSLVRRNLGPLFSVWFSWQLVIVSSFVEFRAGIEELHHIPFTWHCHCSILFKFCVFLAVSRSAFVCSLSKQCAPSCSLSVDVGFLLRNMNYMLEKDTDDFRKNVHKILGNFRSDCSIPFATSAMSCWDAWFRCHSNCNTMHTFFAATTIGVVY